MNKLPPRPDDQEMDLLGDLDREERERQAAHTPTPWVLVPQSDGSNMLARSYETGNQMNPRGLRLIAHVLARRDSLAEDDANAADILKCANAHDDLVAALLSARHLLDGNTYEVGAAAKAIREIDVVLAKVQS